MPNPSLVPPATRTALVLGATGGAGSCTARALLARGWRVQALARDPDAAAARGDLAGVHWLRGDAQQPADVLRAAQGARVIVHALNPPNYQNWRELALPMLANSIAAARATGARILFPGNIYNYDPGTTLLDEATPQRPVSRKGEVRLEMEQLLRDGARQGARAIVLRAGDFFGARSPSSWFSITMVRPGKPVRVVRSPAQAGVGHAWAYLPDLGETFARLADIEGSLPDFDSFHFAGHWTASGDEMGRAIQRVVQAHTGSAPALRGVPWWLMRALAPLVPVLKETMEMRYLWGVPMRLDNRKLVATLGAEPHTPLDTAVHAALLDLGCLPRPAGALVANH